MNSARVTEVTIQTSLLSHCLIFRSVLLTEHLSPQQMSFRQCLPEVPAADVFSGCSFFEAPATWIEEKTLKGLSWSEIDSKPWGISVHVLEEWLNLERKQELEVKGISTSGVDDCAFWVPGPASYLSF